jgi:tetratricopeptide (TPR) repeat protein
MSWFRQLRGAFFAILYSLRRFLDRLVRWPGRMLSATFRAIASWWQSREAKRLLWGLPALIVVTASLSAAGLLASGSAAAKAIDYLTAAKQALGAKNFKAAKLYFEKAIQLGDTSPATLFDFAQTAQLDEDHSRVTAIMAKLAPLSHPVHAQSHIWQAVTILGRNDQLPSSFADAETHLLHALEIEPNNDGANALLGDLYFSHGYWEKATEHLSLVAGQYPEKALTLARAYEMANDAVRSQRWADTARSFLRRRLDSEPKNVTYRLELADVELFVRQYQTAIDLLTQGFRFGDDARLRQAIANVYSAWADELLKSDSEPQRRQAFELISQAILVNPMELSFFGQLMTLLHAETELSAEVRTFLQQNIAEGRALALSHLALGTLGGQIGEDEQSQFHLERAQALLPDVPLIANNLAFYLVRKTPPDPDRAFQLVELALKTWPSDPRLLDTRGHVLVKQERWKEAIRDLELALPSHRENVETHLALAQAYTAVGQVALAEEHRRLARQFESRRLGATGASP